MKEITINTVNGNINFSDLNRAYTHGGGFHADDVCTVGLLELLKGEELEVVRVFKVPEEIDNQHSIIFDIGNGEFDHHAEPRETYEDGCPLAAFGKVARAILVDGETLEDIYPGFVKLIAKPIEAHDNGYVAEDIKESYFAEVINAFGTLWNKDENPDTQFRIAVNVVKPILQRQLDSLASKKLAKEVVESAPVVGRVIVLDKFAPWQDYIDEKVLGAVFPSNRGGWNVQLAPAPGQFNRRADFRGDLKESGLVNFIHPAGFLCACDTREQALQVINYILPRPDYAESDSATSKTSLF